MSPSDLPTLARKWCLACSREGSFLLPPTDVCICNAIAAAVREALEPAIRALEEIADEARPVCWCIPCAKWVRPEYQSGSSYCGDCKQDIYSDSAEARYEEIARNTIAALREGRNECL